MSNITSIKAYITPDYIVECGKANRIHSVAVYEIATKYNLQYLEGIMKDRLAKINGDYKEQQPVSYTMDEGNIKMDKRILIHPPLHNFIGNVCTPAAF